MKALQYVKYITVNKAVIDVAASWILQLHWLLPLFGIGKYEFAYSYGMCTIQWDNQPKLSFIIFITYCIFIGSICIIITSIWTFIYTSKYLRSRSRRKSLLFTHRQKKTACMYLKSDWTVWNIFTFIMYTCSAILHYLLLPCCIWLCHCLWRLTL